MDDSEHDKFRKIAIKQDVNNQSNVNQKNRKEVSVTHKLVLSADACTVDTLFCESSAVSLLQSLF